MSGERYVCIHCHSRNNGKNKTNGSLGFELLLWLLLCWFFIIPLVYSL